MRQLAVVILLFVLAADTVAQQETLFKLDEETGGFGGPVFKYTSIHGQGVMMIGGRGGWVIGHSLILGGGGYGMVTEVDAPSTVMPQEGPLDIHFETFGFEIEYVFDPMSITHMSFYTLIGGGSVHYFKDVGPFSSSNQQIGETGFMFVVEPAINAELNLMEWFRVSAGVSYRFVTGVNHVGLNNDDFKTMSFSVTLKFGTF